MPIGNSSFFDSAFITQVIEQAILFILILYAIFALIIVKQVGLMSETLITPVSPVIKAVAIVHAGFAVGFVFLAFGLL